jgi:hypothetical protein
MISDQHSSESIRLALALSAIKITAWVREGTSLAQHGGASVARAQEQSAVLMAQAIGDDAGGYRAALTCAHRLINQGTAALQPKPNQK